MRSTFTEVPTVVSENSIMRTWTDAFPEGAAVRRLHNAKLPITPDGWLWQKMTAAVACRMRGRKTSRG